MNLFIYPLIVALTVTGIVLFPILYALWRTVVRWDKGRIMRHFVWIYGRSWMGIVSPFVRFKREGFRNNRIDLPCIIVVNHFSFFDTYCMALLPFSDVTFALRSWPFKMLWYAPFMRLAGYLDLETIGWEGTLEVSSRVFSKKGTILFFPEGHRSKDGKIQRFHSGPFKLAVETGVPILPLSMTGTDVLLPPHRWWLKPATICLRALPLVSPGAFTGETAHVEMRKYVQRMIAENFEQMRSEAN